MKLSIRLMVAFLCLGNAYAALEYNPITTQPKGAAFTNVVRSIAGAITNDMATVDYVDGVSNSLFSSSGATNGLASIEYVDGVSNTLRTLTNDFASIPYSVDLSNGLRSQIIVGGSATNVAWPASKANGNILAETNGYTVDLSVEQGITNWLASRTYADSKQFFPQDNTNYGQITWTVGPVAATAFGSGSNMVLGVNAAKYMTDSAGSPFEYSTIFGYTAATFATNASRSAFFGYEAGAHAVNAKFATAVGTAAGAHATNGIYGSFLGYSAGRFAAESDGAVMIGTDAGRWASNANSTIMIGHRAGEMADGSTDSILIGKLAGPTNKATKAVMIGREAGYLSTNDSEVVFIGHQAGQGQPTTGISNSIAIGSRAKVNSSNQTVIGNTNTTSIKLYGLISGDNNIATTNYVNSAVQNATDPNALTNNFSQTVTLNSNLTVNGTITGYGKLAAYNTWTGSNVFSGHTVFNDDVKFGSLLDTITTTISGGIAEFEDLTATAMFMPNGFSSGEYDSKVGLRVDTNGVITSYAPSNYFSGDTRFGSTVWATNGFLGTSNSWQAFPTLAKGQFMLLSSNGTPYVIASGPTGTLTTNMIGGGTGSADTNGLATTNYVQALTNVLATSNMVWVSSNALNAAIEEAAGGGISSATATNITRNIVTYEYLPGSNVWAGSNAFKLLVADTGRITNLYVGVASAPFLYTDATGAIGSTNGAWLTNGLATTNFATSYANALTNTMATTNFVTTYANALTNNFATKAFAQAQTNEFASTNFVTVYANKLTNTFATTNFATSYANALTNTFATTNFVTTYANALTNNFATKAFAQAQTNEFASTNYVTTYANKLTNTFATTNFVTDYANKLTNTFATTNFVTTYANALTNTFATTNYALAISNSAWLNASNLVNQGTNKLGSDLLTYIGNRSNDLWLNASNLVNQGTNKVSVDILTWIGTKSNDLWLSASNLTYAATTNIPLSHISTNGATTNYYIKYTGGSIQWAAGGGVASTGQAVTNELAFGNTNILIHADTLQISNVTSGGQFYLNLTNASLAMGTDSTVVGGAGSTAFGYDVSVNGDNAFGQGYQTSVSGNNSFGAGYRAQVGVNEAGIINFSTQTHSNGLANSFAIYTDAGLFVNDINILDSAGVVQASITAETGAASFQSMNTDDMGVGLLSVTNIEGNLSITGLLASASGVYGGTSNHFSGITVFENDEGEGTNWFDASYFTNGIFGNGAGLTNVAWAGLANSNSYHGKFTGDGSGLTNLTGVGGAMSTNDNIIWGGTHTFTNTVTFSGDVQLPTITATNMYVTNLTVQNISGLPTNTASAEGVVKRGSGQASKVWKTDGSGVPDWRDDATAAPGGGIDEATARSISQEITISNLTANTFTVNFAQAEVETLIGTDVTANNSFVAGTNSDFRITDDGVAFGDGTGLTNYQGYYFANTNQLMVASNALSEAMSGLGGGGVQLNHTNVWTGTNTFNGETIFSGNVQLPTIVSTNMFVTNLTALNMVGNGAGITNLVGYVGTNDLVQATNASWIAHNSTFSAYATLIDLQLATNGLTVSSNVWTQLQEFRSGFHFGNANENMMVTDVDGNDFYITNLNTQSSYRFTDGDLIVNGGFSGSGAGLTGIPLSAVPTAQQGSAILTNLAVGNAQDLVNVFSRAVVTRTNASLGGTVVDFAHSEWTTNATGNIELSSLANVNNTNLNWTVYNIMPNGSDRTVTISSSWKSDTGARTFTATNGTVMSLYIRCQVNYFTNVYTSYAW